MSLQDFIKKYTNVRVGNGECGTLVRQYWIEVDHTNPQSYPSSKDYWYNPVNGYDKVSTPQEGDIAIYDGHGTYTDGHSAIYVDGRVFEQNADPDGSPAHLYLRKNTYLLGYLRKQGAKMQPLTPAQVDHVLKMGLRREPTAEELNNPAYAASAALLIDTVWNNGGKQSYENRDQGFTPVTEQLYKKV